MNQVILTDTNAISRYACVATLSAASLELSGLKFNGPKRLTLLKDQLGLPKRHPDAMTFMYANAAYYVAGVISERMYQYNIKTLNKYGK